MPFEWARVRARRGASRAGPTWPGSVVSRPALFSRPVKGPGAGPPLAPGSVPRELPVPVASSGRLPVPVSAARPGHGAWGGWSKYASGGQFPRLPHPFKAVGVLFFFPFLCLPPCRHSQMSKSKRSVTERPPATLDQSLPHVRFRRPSAGGLRRTVRRGRVRTAAPRRSPKRHTGLAGSPLEESLVS